MKLLETYTIHDGSQPHYLKLYQGDITAIPPEEAVDLLIVSAFPDDYTPTATSVIGALHRRGISVAHLALDKEVDLRGTCACWLSKDLYYRHPSSGFRRLLCFEPLERGNPPETVGDIFRGIMPFVLGEPPIRSIAMPVLASGDQHFDSGVMFKAIFDASTHWFASSLPVETIKVIVNSPAEAERLHRVFSSLIAERLDATSGEPVLEVRSDGSYDLFVSYAHADSEEVDVLVETLNTAKPNLRVFQDKLELKVGDAWQTELDRALEQCRKVVVVYSPSYLTSKMCMEEFNMARLRHRESAEGILLPLYLRTVTLPLYMRSLQYIDCREGDRTRIQSACIELVRHVTA